MKISISGASGWLGKSAMAAWIKVNPIDWSEKLVALSRSDKDISLKNSEIVSITQANNISKSKIDLHIPLASFDRGNYYSVGPLSYWKINSGILKRELEFIEQKNIKNVLLISSGVVINPSDKQIQDPSYVEYAKFKKLQEIEFAKLIGSDNLSICYVYSGTSLDMNIESNFMIIDLIKSALKNETIQIRSNQKVLRRYMDFRELFELLFMELNRNKKLIFESTGDLIEIEQLATLIQKIINPNVNILRNSTIYNNVDAYYSNNLELDKLYKIYNIKKKTVEDQITNLSTLFNNR